MNHELHLSSRSTLYMLISFVQYPNCSFLSCNDPYNSCLSRKLKSNSSLFHLTHLRKLNLAFIDFQESTLPSEFGRHNALTHLHLSETNFGGEIPMEFYRLSNMLSLDLSNVYGPQIRCDVKMLFGNMEGLRVLLLPNQNLSNSELPINMSSFLTHLDLSNTGLQGNLPATIFEKPNLQILRLNDNYDLNSSLPKSLNWSNVHSIQVLDLWGTSMSGRLPNSIGLMTNLNNLDLSWTSMSGRLPDSIGWMTNLNYLDLSLCIFSGPIPESISNITAYFQLDVSRNHLEGQLLDALWGLQKLTHLDLSYNCFAGQIQSSLTNMSRLENLEISSNAFTGSLPSAAGHDFNICVIWICPTILSKLLAIPLNRLTGRIGKLNSDTLVLKIKLESFYNLSSIEDLLISHNRVTEHDGDIVNVTFPYLEMLEMSSCQIKKFLNFLQSNISILDSLDLSNNSIHGPIPSWLPSKLSFLDLHSNSLQGTFPSSICSMIGLSILSLSDNKLSGNIPECLANSTTQLQVLDLSRNEFHGIIPTIIGAMYQLVILGLNGNHLQWTLPTSLANCTELEILILKSNSFHGYITPPFTNDSFSLQILDLSYNNFTGLLPKKLFASLEAIKQSSQASPYAGYEYSVTLAVKGIVVEFTKLDLSSNQLTGGIPQTLTNLTFLGDLDLSHNHLVGPIPQANQFLTFSNESYASNSGLCGAPLTRSCGVEKESLEEVEEEEDDGFMMGFSWKVVVMGYGCGILLGFILGNVMISIKKPKWLERFVMMTMTLSTNIQKLLIFPPILHGAHDGQIKSDSKASHNGLIDEGVQPDLTCLGQVRSDLLIFKWTVLVKEFIQT
ncbi:hypothetical protein ACS0TY_000283 [Phlomoides rotata]